ncbi:MAG TPA: TonB-dependent receptor [Acidobacteriota bacterium]|nr:TonB-dependent receptor [Acidobacteriota bacterium]
MRLSGFRTISALLVLLLAGLPLMAQTGAGGIQGVVRDASGGIIPGVEVSITNPRTGRTINTITNDSGFFTVRSLPAGSYEVKASIEGFKTKIINVAIEVGAMANGDVTLEVGTPDEVITVSGEAIRVDTVDHEVSGAITSEQVRNLPLNGRNFLDLAQTQPGVQLVDGGSFDPTKNQFTGISVAGRSGRVTRISIDGIDISDETVGTTTQNISVDAVQEFEVSQSSYDASTSLGSAGSVNIITKSGSNEFHGSGFIFYRDEEVAALPTTRTGSPQTIANLESAEFDREQGGFEVGGPLVKDRVFFFINYEKLNQDGSTFTSLPSFPNFNGAVTTPFNDNLGIGRLDFNLSDSMTAFGRFSHETNDAATGFGGTNLAPFVNQNVTNVTAFGFDAATSSLTHSVRYGFTSFDNEISTNNLGLPEFSASNGTPVSVAINSRATFFSGPNRLAPQATYQTDHQWKYDGAYIRGNHTFRFGSELKWTKTNLFASFFGVGPEVRLAFDGNIRQAIIDRGGNPNDPLEYPVSFAILGNGQGSFTEIANNNRPRGGINNTRFAWYVEDSWRVTPTFNLNLALRWDINTGQVNDDLGLPSQLSTVLGPDIVNPVDLDKNNFGPRIGFAWQPFGNNETVIRAGAGIYYETNIFNNVIFDRTDRLAEGLGFNTAVPPLGNIDAMGRVLVSGMPVNNIDTTAWSGVPLGTVIDQIGQTQADFQAASAQVPFDPNGTPLILVNGTTFSSIFSQDYQTPYSIQTNLGVEHQLSDTWTMSVDYLRNKSLHHNLVRDFNRHFAADTLDVAGAAGAIQSTLNSMGVGSIDEAIAAGASINSFGLANFFVGVDPNFTAINVLESSGRSTYNALQFRTTGRFTDMDGFVRNMWMNISYNLSRFEVISGDQDFLPSVAFNDNFLSDQNRGPGGTDRTHQLSAQFFMDLPWGFGLNWNQRWATALPQNLLLSGAGGGNNIFTSDLDGDGTSGDFVGDRGDFGRGISSVDELNALINGFNSSIAGNITPAGRALVSAGLFTEAQLIALGAVAPSLQLAPAGQVFNDSFITSDIRVTKHFEIGGGDRVVTISPSVEIFNLFNVANYGRLGNSANGILSGQPGAPNGTVQGTRTNLIGLGSGSFSQGIPRSFQFALRVSF